MDSCSAEGLGKAMADLELPVTRARLVDFAVGGFWLVSLIIFIAGQQQRLNLPERHKHKADPLFYTGIVLIAIATPVLLCYLVVRVSRSGAAARVANPATDDGEWVSLLPGSAFSCSKARATSASDRRRASGRRWRCGWARRPTSSRRVRRHRINVGRAWWGARGGLRAVRRDRRRSSA